jgi:hypothetical protein
MECGPSGRITRPGDTGNRIGISKRQAMLLKIQALSYVKHIQMNDQGVLFDLLSYLNISSN